MAAAAGWLERPVLNSFSFDACIETFAHLRFAPPTSAARCASVMNEPWTCSQLWGEESGRAAGHREHAILSLELVDRVLNLDV